MAKWHYLQLRLWFNKGYIVRFGGRPISPMSIFRRSLVEFMAAVVTEKSNMEDEAPSMPGCSSDEVVKRMEEFLKEEDEDLLVVFHDLVKKGHDSLDWSSGTFKITTRRPEDAFEESLTFLDFILLSEGHQEDAMVTVSQDDAQGGDADNDPLMAEGPISPLAAVSGQNKRKSAPEVEASDGDGASSSQTTTQSIQAVLPRKKRRRVPAAEVENDRTEGGRALPSDVKGKARAL